LPTNAKGKVYAAIPVGDLRDVDVEVIECILLIVPEEELS
jgi:hypothetical protein